MSLNVPRELKVATAFRASRPDLPTPVMTTLPNLLIVDRASNASVKVVSVRRRDEVFALELEAADAALAARRAR